MVVVLEFILVLYDIQPLGAEAQPQYSSAQSRSTTTIFIRSEPKQNHNNVIL